jgi:hypothetical protein
MDKTALSVLLHSTWRTILANIALKIAINAQLLKIVRIVPMVSIGTNMLAAVAQMPFLFALSAHQIPSALHAKKKL